MIRDRLPDLHRLQNFNNEQRKLSKSKNSFLMSTNINGAESSLKTENRSEKFLQHVSELRESISNLQIQIRNLQERQSNLLKQAVVKIGEKEQLLALIDKIKFQIWSLRPRICKIEEELKNDELNPSIELRTGAELRIRRNQCEMLKRYLNEVLDLFNHVQIEYKRRVSIRVKRQLDAAGKYYSAFEINQMLESKSQETFYRQLMPVPSFAAQIALEDATNRHNEILKLELNINELKEIFCDLYNLVHSQDKIVDRIETNVELANDYITDSQIKVREAVCYKKSSKKKFYLLLLASFVLLFVCIVLLSFRLMPFSSATF